MSTASTLAAIFATRALVFSFLAMAPSKWPACAKLVDIFDVPTRILDRYIRHRARHDSIKAMVIRAFRHHRSRVSLGHDELPKHSEQPVPLWLWLSQCPRIKRARVNRYGIIRLVHSHKYRPFGFRQYPYLAMKPAHFNCSRPHPLYPREDAHESDHD